MEIIKSLESILKRNVDEKEWGNIDLENSDNIYHRFYFNYLDDDSQEEAIGLFPNSEELFKRFKEVREIEKGYKIPDTEIQNNSLKNYLSGISEYLEDEELARFLKEDFEIIRTNDTETPPEPNKLHREVYGDLGEIINEFYPMGHHFHILYAWSINTTAWMNVTGFLIGLYLEEEAVKDAPFFKDGLDLYKYGIHKNYWLKDNSIESGVVYWNLPNR